MTSVRRLALAGSACALALAGGVGGAAAQDQEAARSGVFETIVVTAQKREENVQDVGISVSAYSGDQLEALG
ncbi:MAG: hypothetical protein MI723_02365, partial [Caulobacterales bacterium]|nr:hypothetical protein [Caulobacterales bacterium]